MKDTIKFQGKTEPTVKLIFTIYAFIYITFKNVRYEDFVLKLKNFNDREF